MEKTFSQKAAAEAAATLPNHSIISSVGTAIAPSSVNGINEEMVDAVAVGLVVIATRVVAAEDRFVDPVVGPLVDEEEAVVGNAKTVKVSYDFFDFSKDAGFITLNNVRQTRT